MIPNKTLKETMFGLSVLTPTSTHSQHMQTRHAQIYSHPPAPELVAGVDEAAAPPSAAAAVASGEGAGTAAKASDEGQKRQHMAR